MDRKRQAEGVGDDETGIEDEVDPVAQHPAINDLAGDPDEGQNEEPERRGGGVLVPILPLLVGLQPERGEQDEGAPPADDFSHDLASPSPVGRGIPFASRKDKGPYKERIAA